LTAVDMEAMSAQEGTLPPLLHRPSTTYTFALCDTSYRVPPRRSKQS
jgi:hypothetical protein